MKTNFYGPIITIISGLLTLSIGLNILFYQRIILLDKIIIHTTRPVSKQELEKIQEEIDRLSNIQYDVKTKEPIHNDFLNPKR